MEEKFVNSGYRREDLQDAKQKVLALDRAEVLKPKEQKSGSKQRVLALVINQHPSLRKELAKFFDDNKSKLEEFLGDVRIVIAERKHQNLASLLFQKSGFSKIQNPIRSDQECSSSRCLTRKTMQLKKTELVNGQTIKLDYRQTCASAEIVYLAKCKLCDDPRSESNFYFGQTVNTLMQRCNGHRSGFKEKKEEDSALSMHIYDKHPEKFDKKLENFDFGVVKQVPPAKLDRVEDFYIFITKADINGLNRYKVTK